MTFEIRLVGRPAGPSVDIAADDVDDVIAGHFSRSIIACGYMAEAEGSLKFLLRGFGREAWPVDVRTDLSTVIEDLPEVLQALEAGGSAEINLYEQGIQCLLSITPHDTGFEIRCASRTDWVPDPATEIVDRNTLLDMLRALAHDFETAVKQVCPAIAAHEPIRSWAAEDL